jgi:haloalkane dehalogenase
VGHFRVLEEFKATHFIRVGSASLCYHKAGKGPALVLIHGYPLSSQTWRKVVPELSKWFTCYAPDLIGLGNSTSTDASHFGSQGQAQVLQRALVDLGVASYILIGNDSGGWVARDLALLDSGRVTHLILTNTEIPFHRPPWVPFYQFLAKAPGGAHAFRFMLGSRLWRHSQAGFGGCFENLDLIEGEFMQQFLKPLLTSEVKLRNALRFLTSMQFERVDEFERLHVRLSMPVAFIWAARDRTFPERLALEMAKQFPQVSQFISLPRGKLFFYEEFADSLVNPVLDLMIRRVV